MEKINKFLIVINIILYLTIIFIYLKISYPIPKATFGFILTGYILISIFKSKQEKLSRLIYAVYSLIVIGYFLSLLK